MLLFCFKIWTNQISKDPKFHPAAGPDENFFRDFEDDEKGVVLIATFSLQPHVVRSPAKYVLKKFKFSNFLNGSKL